MRSILLLVVLILAPLISLSHPVAFEGAVALLGENNQKMTDTQLMYSYRYWGSAGLQNTTLRHGGKSHQYTFAKANFLAGKWLFEDSQANVYLGGGYGQGKLENNNAHQASLWTVQADWESRKYYVMASKTEIFDQGGGRLSVQSEMQRAGLAPFLGDFKDLNIWWILERSRLKQESEMWSQILRFYHRNVLWEVGANDKGHLVFNYMIHF